MGKRLEEERKRRRQLRRQLEVQGPRRASAAYYIGQTYRGLLTQMPDSEFYPNGAVASKRNKAARRMIRKVFGRSMSRIEQHVLKARDLTNEMRRLASGGREGKRYLEKTLAVHQPVPQPVLRAERRALEREGKRLEKRRAKELARAR
jgi:hypothetical protein